jgi:hypothetical protein
MIYLKRVISICVREVNNHILVEKDSKEKLTDIRLYFLVKKENGILDWYFFLSV